MKQDAQVAKVQSQFNQQAERFYSWEVTGSEQNLEQFFRFCKLHSDDRVLDVACGTGNMVNYCAPRVASADGVDIAERMIFLARSEAERRQLSNAQFSIAPVEALPFPAGRFTAVMSRAAFHHFADPRRVIGEMRRCCTDDGRLFIQDIVAYAEPAIDAYVEELELAIDSSHCRTLARDAFTDLFTEAGLVGVHGIEFNIALDLVNYIGHAIQSDAARAAVDRLVKRGLDDPRLSGVIEQRDGRLILKRRVLFLGGNKTSDAQARAGSGRPRIICLDFAGRTEDAEPTRL